MAKKNKKNPGKVYFKDNKVRIEFKKTTESILFEDISSMSNSKGSAPKVLYIIGGFVLFYIVMMLTVQTTESGGPLTVIGSIIVVACMIGGFILAYKKKDKWDIVIVETRGGKEVIFSVPDGQGIETVDSIEDEKRKHSK